MFHVKQQNLFTNTELREDHTQQIISKCLSNNLTKHLSSGDVNYRRRDNVLSFSLGIFF